MDDSRFETLLRDFVGDTPPRVWSLLVTVFGELAQAPEAQISSPLLGQLLGQLGIKPEAMRVALHRLRKEGWIEGHRVGRSSAYALTDWGRGQSAAASPLIYAETALAETAWLGICDPSRREALSTDESHWVAPNLMVTATLPRDSDVMCIPLETITPLPRWLSAKLCDPQTLARSQELATRLAQLRTALAQLPPPDTLQSATLRVVIVHGWRRVVLKCPALPDHVLPEDWNGPACRALVRDLLSTLPPCDIATLATVSS